MTKKQVAKKLNGIIKRHTREIIDEVNEVLISEDMWYGDCTMDVKRAKNKKFSKDRNADQFVSDGVLEGADYTIEDWFWTRKEVEDAEF